MPSVRQENITIFHESNSERRASVVSSNGKASAFSPADFTSPFLDPLLSAPRNERSKGQIPELVLEEATLLRDHNVSFQQYGAIQSEQTRQSVDDAWESAIITGKIQDSTNAREIEYLISSSVPLVITLVLQYSLSLASVFSVGHLGSRELAAVSLGAMTANITGYTVIQGLATALDTLCPQAFGARKYQMVGAYFQKCTALIFTLLIPVMILWIFYAEVILRLFLPDLESAALAASYLKVVSIGIPGYILFETGKRFLQAQGIFQASTYALFLCAPLNMVMNYLFVWSPSLGIGYLGAPLSVAISYWLMPLCLLLYTLRLNKHQKEYPPPLVCWNGIKVKEAFSNWVPLLKLALPGLIMISAEFIAFEFTTLLSSKISATALASQAVCVTIGGITYQIPFALSIAASTRIANFLGSGLPLASKRCTKVAFLLATVVSLANFLILEGGRWFIPLLFTSDPDVIGLASSVLVVLGLVQALDAINTVSAGCLRGQGQQKIGGIVNITSYYFIGIPLATFFAFKLSWGLQGLWAGSATAILLIATVQTYFSLNARWPELLTRAQQRNLDAASR